MTKAKEYGVSFTRTVVTKETATIIMGGARTRAAAIRAAKKLANDPNEIFWATRYSRKLRGKPVIFDVSDV